MKPTYQEIVKISVGISKIPVCLCYTFVYMDVCKCNLFNMILFALRIEQSHQLQLLQNLFLQYHQDWNFYPNALFLSLHIIRFCNILSFSTLIRIPPGVRKPQIQVTLRKKCKWLHACWFCVNIKNMKNRCEQKSGWMNAYFFWHETCSQWKNTSLVNLICNLW